MKRKPNPFILRPDGVVEITLNHGQVALVDAPDWETVAKYHWLAGRNARDRTWYAVGTMYDDPARHVVRMHRLILGFPVDTGIDHVNGVGTDNRRCNLRPCGQFENSANARKWLRASSRFKGVTWWKRYGLWKAQIMIAGRNHYLGKFATEIEAARAYDRAATEQFGPYARLNGV